LAEDQRAYQGINSAKSYENLYTWGIFRIVIRAIPAYRGMPEGTVAEVEAVYIDAHPGFVHSGQLLPGRLIRLGPV
jgi:hypothetical protein